MSNYTIGLDFGSLSGRGVLVDTADGAIVAQSAYEYPHGILTEQLPDGTPLGQDWALQNPMDYLAVLDHVIPALLDKAGVPAQAVAAVGIDFTASTPMPIQKDGTPLSENPVFANNPHAWCKLWKHHGAMDEARDVTAAAVRHAPKLLQRCGGRVSPESLMPKILQIYREAPEVYAAAHQFVEAGDWVAQQLTGHPVRSGTLAASKALWDRGSGYPGPVFFASLAQGFEHMPKEKLLPDEGFDMVYPGSVAGRVSTQAAKRYGLRQGTVVTSAHSDGHVGVASVGITGPGSVLLTIGTSIAIIFQDFTEQAIPGMCSIAPDCDYPGLVGYAAGQCSVGDCFQWFMDTCLPQDYARQAQKGGMSPYAYLDRLASGLKPGASGLLAMDWWNGNRSCLLDSSLSGMVLGLTLQTKPEEIYRALLEAVAFGSNKIFKTIQQYGQSIEAIYAGGGIAIKNPLLMQIYADVTGMPVSVSTCDQIPALGSAIFAAAAAGKARGGWDSIPEAIGHMSWKEQIQYLPREETRGVYGALQQEYDKLHDYFGRGENNVMKTLRSIRRTCGS